MRAIDWWGRSFPLNRQTEHYSIYASLSNPRHGKGSGTHGVRCAAVVDAYAEALEECYALLAGAPWLRRCQRYRAVVVVCDVKRLVPEANGFISPSAWRGRRLQIALSARPGGLSPDEEARKARSIAIHECTHLFNLWERPLTEERTADWEWLDEAEAVYREGELCGAAGDWIRHASEWTLRPERSLDTPGAGYSASLMVAALVQKHGPELLRKVWMESGREQTALEALDTALNTLGSALAESGRPDFFAGYCADSWFGAGAPPESMLGAAWRRHGDRALRESWEPVRRGCGATDRIESLACHYYRAALPVRGALRVTVRTHPGPAAGQLKVLVCTATDEGTAAGPRQPVIPGTTEGAIVSSDQPAWAIIVVCHCGWKTDPDRTPIAYDLTLEPVQHARRR